MDQQPCLRPISRLAPLLGIALVLACAAAPADASTPLGQLPLDDPGTCCNWDVFGLRVQSPGVVTSWQVRGSDNSADAGSTAELRLWQHTPSGTQYQTATLLASSRGGDVHSGVNAFPA